MKIVHLCLSCFYIDDYAYQENELVAQNVLDGHDVLVVASTETYGPDKRLAYLAPSEYMGGDGARVIRLPYRKWLPHRLMRKVRAHPGVFDLLERERPDVVLFHGLCGWELLSAARYKIAHPEVRFYVDSHEDQNNSARTFVSNALLHRSFYRPIIRKCLGAIDKVLCISVDTMNFVKDMYDVPQACLEFYPLGGRVFEEEEYRATRHATRAEYGVGDTEVLFVQSGKMDGSKKVLESLRAFAGVDDARFRFILVGHLQDDIASEAEALMNRDPRVRFVGWKTPDELRRILCAADVYVQPGTQSATMQMSICCRCTVILDDVASHKPFVAENGWLVGGEFSLDQAFNFVTQSKDRLSQMSENSREIAARLLDYRALASRLYR